MQASCTRSLLLAMSMALIAPTSWASNFTLTMDDLPMQPVNGLVHPSGVTFGFTVSGRPNDDARYAAGGPGSIEFVQDPSIEGTATGVLSIRFSQPATPISFGVARNLFNTSTANVELFDATNTSLGVQVLPLAPMPTYPEGRFSHSGQAISRLTVSFPPPDQSRFAFDNLSFRLIPEPATLVMALAAVAFGLAGRQRRNCRRMLAALEASAPPKSSR
jgi:hypothetical protein